jgi:hypothetical protein
MADPPRRSLAGLRPDGRQSLSLHNQPETTNAAEHARRRSFFV